MPVSCWPRGGSMDTSAWTAMEEKGGDSGRQVSRPTVPAMESAGGRSQTGPWERGLPGMACRGR